MLTISSWVILVKLLGRGGGGGGREEEGEGGKKGGRHAGRE